MSKTEVDKRYYQKHKVKILKRVKKNYKKNRVKILVYIAQWQMDCTL